MEAWIVLGIAVSVLIYLGGSYVEYRVVRKFNDTISFSTMLIPFWSWYQVLKVAVDKPVMYFWGTALAMIMITIVTQDNSHTILNNILQILANALLWLVPYSLIARKLGKNIWLYAVLLFIPFLSLIATLMIAFDNSKPLHSDSTLKNEI